MNRSKINPMLDCTYGSDEFGLYANSREEYWSELKSRNRITSGLIISQLVKYVYVLDDKQQTWNRIFHIYDKNYTRVNKLFR